jgi:hypothetical protein
LTFELKERETYQPSRKFQQNLQKIVAFSLDEKSAWNLVRVPAFRLRLQMYPQDVGHFVKILYNDART